MADRSGAIRALLAAACAAAMLSGCGPDKAPQAGGVAARPAGEARPNVLLILIDHLGPEFDVYGDQTPETPNLDRLAKGGEVFEKAYAASGSDDAAYASLLTGVYPQTIGVVHEWVSPTGRGWTVAPPPEVQGFPQTLRAAGYDTFHVGERTDPFEASSALWTAETITAAGEAPAPWPPAQLSQPFFGEIDLSTLQADAPAAKAGWFSGLFGAEPKRPAPIAVKPVDPAKVQVPAYLPDSHSMRVALAHRYEAIERVDAEIGQILARLDKLGLSSTTDVIVTARSGPALPRAERTLYESGVRIPLIVHRADGKGAGAARKDIVSGVDLAPSILTRAGLKPFAWMQGRERFVAAADPERYAYSVQGSVGGVPERAFAIRDGRWLYIHNLAFRTSVWALSRQEPARIAFVAVAREIRRVERPGLTPPPKLTPAQERIFHPARADDEDRPEDEFYDLQTDPFQLTNLAQEDKYADELHRLSDALDVFAAAAPDYSTWSERDLTDLFRPGGVTPTTAPPTGVTRAGRLTLESETPGAAILWRPKDGATWRLYTGPVPAAGEIQAKAARYGFVDSAVTVFPAGK